MDGPSRRAISVISPYTPGRKYSAHTAISTRACAINCMVYRQRQSVSACRALIRFPLCSRKLLSAADFDISNSLTYK